MSDSTFKATCSCCKRKKDVLELATVRKTRQGSYNRAPSSVRGMVCRDCTNEAVASTRARRYVDGRVFGVVLNSTGFAGVSWSSACDHFGIDYSDLPRTEANARNHPDKFQNALDVK